jgi:23S rRNA pseudouridine2605 synthase
MEIRLQKVLAQAGLASRRKAEELILAGRVEVNSKIVREMGIKVDPSRDLIRVDGKLLREREQKVYFLLYKPAGMVTTLSDPQGRATIKDCLKGIEERVFAVGRLDWDAEGALLITNDGEIANRLMHPRFQVPRTYLAKVKGDPDEATVNKLREGVRLEDGMVKPESVDVERETEKNTWLRLVVSEGRSHLVKRLCAAVGHPVVRLFRPQYAGIGVEGLRPGELRRLTAPEVEQLRHAGPIASAEAVPMRMPARRHRVGPKPAKPASKAGAPTPGSSELREPKGRHDRSGRRRGPGRR